MWELVSRGLALAGYRYRKIEGSYLWILSNVSISRNTTDSFEGSQTLGVRQELLAVPMETKILRPHSKIRLQTWKGRGINTESPDSGFTRIFHTSHSRELPVNL